MLQQLHLKKNYDFSKYLSILQKYCNSEEIDLHRIAVIKSLKYCLKLLIDLHIEIPVE